MTIATQIALAVRRVRHSFRRHRTQRMMESLPLEVLKDIGWQLEHRRSSH